MPIMSDKWIKFKAENDQLIVPFHAESRSSNEDGTPVTSYGLSSFGYDIRLGNIFRFFNRSNPNNLNVEVRSVRDSIGPDVIDPVNFNEALTSRHELRDDECITIPPHGFMLGVSKERIKLGDEFTAICMEKSTLARCFTGDTKIALADGTSPTFLEAIERIKNGERLFGYSVNEEANITIAELIEPRKIGREEILEVVLDNGEIIRCTADHKFLTLDCDYVEAKDLVEGQSLYPLYRTVSRGYEAVYQPMDPYIVSTHHLSDEYNLRHGVYKRGFDEHRHHVDGNRRNNTPMNIVRMKASDHIKMHNLLNSERPEYKEKLSLAQKESWKKQAESDPTFVNHWRGQSSKASKAFWNDDRYYESRQRWFTLNRERVKNLSEEQRQALADRARKFLCNVTKEMRIERAAKRWMNEAEDSPNRRFLGDLVKRKDITEETLEKALKEAGSIRGASRLLSVDRTAFRRFPELIKKYKEMWNDAAVSVDDIKEALKENLSLRSIAEKLGVSKSYIVRRMSKAKKALNIEIGENHKVVTVRKASPGWEGEQDVYCLTAPEYGNFALESGVFVHNCGLCVTVTPLEAGWEGYVTLELSNKTDSPIKLTPGMGICQVLFIHGNESCEVSYADRSGKYQDQPAEPVLPRRKM